MFHTDDEIHFCCMEKSSLNILLMGLEWHEGEFICSFTEMLLCKPINFDNIDSFLSIILLFKCTIVYCTCKMCVIYLHYIGLWFEFTASCIWQDCSSHWFRGDYDYHSLTVIENTVIIHSNHTWFMTCLVCGSVCKLFWVDCKSSHSFFMRITEKFKKVKHIFWNAKCVRPKCVCFKSYKKNGFSFNLSNNQEMLFYKRMVCK